MSLKLETVPLNKSVFFLGAWIFSDDRRKRIRMSRSIYMYTLYGLKSILFATFGSGNVSMYLGSGREFLHTSARIHETFYETRCLTCIYSQDGSHTRGRVVVLRHLRSDDTRTVQGRTAAAQLDDRSLQAHLRHLHVGVGGGTY